MKIRTYNGKDYGVFYSTVGGRWHIAQQTYETSLCGDHDLYGLVTAPGGHMPMCQRCVDKMFDIRTQNYARGIELLRHHAEKMDTYATIREGGLVGIVDATDWYGKLYNAHQRKFNKVLDILMKG